MKTLIISAFSLLASGCVDLSSADKVSVSDVIWDIVIVLIASSIMLLPFFSLSRRLFIGRKLRAITAPDFHPTEFYVEAAGGIAIDTDRGKFAAATFSASVVLEAADISEIQVQERQLQQLQEFVVDIDLQSNLIPHLRLTAYLRSERLLRIISLLKALQHRAKPTSTTCEGNNNAKEELRQTVFAPQLEKELAALAHAVSRLTTALTHKVNVSKITNRKIRRQGRMFKRRRF